MPNTFRSPTPPALTRRAFLRVGFLAGAGLGLADYLSLRQPRATLLGAEGVGADGPVRREPPVLPPHPRATITELVFTKTKPSPERLKQRDQLWEERNRAVAAARKANSDAEWVRLVDEANATFLRKLQATWGVPEEAMRRPRALIHRLSAPLYVATEQVVGKPLRPAQRQAVLDRLADWLEQATRLEQEATPESRRKLNSATTQLLQELRDLLQLNQEQFARLRAAWRTDQ